MMKHTIQFYAGPWNVMFTWTFSGLWFSDNNKLSILNLYCHRWTSNQLIRYDKNCKLFSIRNLVWRDVPQWEREAKRGKNVTLRWCESTCQYKEPQTDPESRDLWPWSIWPLIWFVIQNHPTPLLCYSIVWRVSRGAYCLSIRKTFPVEIALMNQTMNFHDHWWELTNVFHQLSWTFVKLREKLGY